MADYTKDNVQSILNKIAKAVNKHRKNLKDNSIPAFSSYSTFQSKQEAFQEELTKFSEFLTDNTREHSKVKSRIVYIGEMQDKLNEFPPEMKMEAKKKLKSYKSQLKTIASTLRNRGKNARKLIESLRSMQSHSGKRHSL